MTTRSRPTPRRCEIALREKGAPFQLALPGGLGAGGAAGEFAEANPRAEVPVLIDGDVRVFDSTIILEYLEDRFPAPAMLPATPAERARVRMIEEVMDTHYEAINWAMGEINWFRRAEGEAAGGVEGDRRRQTAGFLAWLERPIGRRALVQRRELRLGRPRRGSLRRRLGRHGLPRAGGQRRGQAWLARALAPLGRRDGRRSPRLQHRGLRRRRSGGRGLFKREYRDHRLEWMMKSGGVDIVLKGLEAGNIRFTPDFS